MRYAGRMGKQLYRRTTPDTVQGLCLMCGEREQKRKGVKPRGVIYSALCGPCERARFPAHAANRAATRPKRHGPGHGRPKADRCARCGFVAEDPCQLDVDHIDGNHQNDDPNNWQTLCANCHRLKTRRNREGGYALHRRE